MILAILCACQIVAQANTLVVKTGEGEDSIPLGSVRGARYVTQVQLQERLGARVRMLPSGRAVLTLGGVQFELAHGVAFTRVADRVAPLANAPRFTAEGIAVPLQLVTELLPGFARGVAWDARSRTLTLASASGAPAQAGSAPSAAVMRRAPGAIPEDAPQDGVTKTDKAPRESVASASAARKRRIIVDAGHGGPDDGTSVKMANGSRVVEKDITLKVSRLLGDELRKRNFEVVYTRTTDTLIALHDRGKIANRHEGDAFVSIHVNAAGEGAGRAAVRGVETYFLSVAKTEDARRVEAMENSSVRFESGGAPAAAGDPLAFILSDMTQNEHLRQSSDLAAAVQRTLSKSHPGGDRGVKQAGFAVLVGSFMPSVLVEIGYLSNRNDAAFMVNNVNQKKIAVAVADAVAGYFDAYDKRMANGAGR